MEASNLCLNERAKNQANTRLLDIAADHGQRATAIFELRYLLMRAEGEPVDFWRYCRDN